MRASGILAPESLAWFCVFGDFGDGSVLWGARSEVWALGCRV